jgi:hypothetical protein
MLLKSENSSFARDAIGLDSSGVHHKRYTGVAYKKDTNDNTPGVAHYIDSRTTIDRRKVLVRAVSLILNCTWLLALFQLPNRITSVKSVLRILEEMNVHDLRADHQSYAGIIYFVHGRQAVMFVHSGFNIGL